MKILASAIGVLLASAAGVAVAAGEDDQRPWSAAAAAYAYFVPDQPDFVMAVVAADFRRLHLEARYNYEEQHSGSAFVGVNARWGEKLNIAVTPMLGGVAGDLDGLIPALRLTVTWWKLELTSELEYVFDLDDAGASFFYNWSELGLFPVTWLRVGTVIQRSKLLQNSLDVQRGLFVSGTFRFATLSLYELNLAWTTPTWIVAVGVSF